MVGCFPAVFSPLLVPAPSSAADTTPPNPVVLSGVLALRDSIDLAWTAPGDDGGSGTASAYELRYSVIGPLDTLAKFNAATQAGLPPPKTAGSPEAFRLTGLAFGATYYLALRSADEVPNFSALSPPLSMTALPKTLPRPVAGLRGARDEGAGSFTLSWTPAAKFADASSADDDLSRQTVWRATAPAGPFVALATLSTAAAAHTDAGSLAAEAFYAVSAVDVFGSSAPRAASAGNSTETPIVFLAPDSGARLEVPAASQAPLYAPANGLGSDLSAEWTRLNSEETGAVLLAYRLRLVRESDGSEPAVSLPKPGPVLALAAPAGSSGSSLALFRFDGVAYSKIGGTLAPDLTMRIGVSETGRYRLQQSLRTAGFSILSVVPRKVFTPNGDGVHDTITVFVDNPSNEPLSGEVFDLSGARAAHMRSGPTANSLAWDGRDGSGNPARSGVYLYRIAGAEASATGTFVLIR